MPIEDNKILIPITYIQDLARKPTPSEVMTYMQLQAKFDQGAEDVRVKHNNLIDDVILLDNKNIKDNGVQTITGVKTFSESLIIPAPTTNLQPATKKYVDDVGNESYKKSIEDEKLNTKVDKTAYDAQVINAGSSNSEVVDARGIYPKMKNRLDKVDTDLADMPTQSFITEKEKTIDVNIKLGLKTDKVYSDTNLALKRDKSLKLNATVDFDDETKAQLTGVTPITYSPVQLDGSITPTKTSFFKLSKNLFNKDTVSIGYYVSDTNGTIIANVTYNATDFIKISPSTTYTRGGSDGRIAYYDINKVYISGTQSGGLTQTSPANAYYVRYTFFSAIATMQFELGSIATIYEAYYQVIPKEQLEQYPFDATKIPNLGLTYNKTDFITLGKNLFDKSTVTLNFFVNYVTGVLTSSASYHASAFIDVLPSTQYVRSWDSQIAFYDINKVYVSGINSSATPSIPFTTPVNALYCRVTVPNTMLDIFQLELGSIATLYETNGFKMSKLLMGNVATKDTLLIFLPSEICIAVGRTIEIYNKQVAWCGNIDNYHFEWVCTIGKSMKRKWMFTGATDKIGSYALTCNVYDNNMVAVATASTTIKIVDNTIGTALNMLTIGDSLSNTKPWLQEVRTLSSNQITLVGSKGTTPLKHEGYSGFSAGSFLSSVTDDGFQGAQYTMNVTGITTVPIVGKRYNINTYPFEILSTNITSGSGSIIITRLNTGSISLTTGILNAVDGTLAGDTNITYTSAVSSPTNPFWDGTRFNYAWYKTQKSITPNAIQIFLGTNTIALDATVNAGGIKQIVDYIRQDDATIPIFVVFTLYRGDQDGIGNQVSSDGYSAGSNVWKLEEDAKVYNLMVKLNELLKNYTNLKFVPIALTHDSEYNFGSVLTPVNARATNTELIETEATHPQEQGYLQMADIMYSTFCNVF